MAIHLSLSLSLPLSRSLSLSLFLSLYIYIYIHTYIHTYVYIRQNCISDIVTCPAWGGVENATKVASAGLDGKVCVWDLKSRELEEQLSKLSLGAQI